MHHTRLKLATALAIFSFSGWAVAGTNEYGGYDIVEDNAMYASGYGQTKGWQVMAAYEQSRKFAFCYAEPTNEPADNRVRLGWDSLQWQVAVPVKARPNWEGTFEVDGQGGGNGGGSQISGTAAGGRAIAWLGMGEVDLMRAGDEAILGVGKHDYDFSLRGAAAAMLKIEECVKRQGKEMAQKAEKKAPAAKLPTSRQQVGKPVTGTCEGVLFPAYRCKVSHYEPDKGYMDAMQINDTSNQQPSFFVKVKSPEISEVWVRYQGEKQWMYLGFWNATPPGGNCIVPGKNKSKEAIANLGQDAWSLCVN